MKSCSGRTILCVCVMMFAQISCLRSAHAEDAWPIHLTFPHHDWAMGLSGAAAFSEHGGEKLTEALFGVDASYLHDLFGVHLSLRVQTEGDAFRVGALLEASVWYLVMFGVGASVGWLTDDVTGPNPETLPAVHVMVGIPFPLFNLDEGVGGTVVGMPYVRPMIRFLGGEEIAGFFELGVMLKWTSFRY